MKQLLFIPLIITILVHADSSEEALTKAVVTEPTVTGVPKFPDSSQYLNPVPMNEIRKVEGNQELEKTKKAANTKLTKQKAAQSLIIPPLQTFLSTIKATDPNAIVHTNAKAFIAHIQQNSSVSKALADFIKTILTQGNTDFLNSLKLQINYPDIDALTATLTTSASNLATNQIFKKTLQAVLNNLPDGDKRYDAPTIISTFTSNGDFRNFIQMLYTTNIADVKKVHSDKEEFIDMYNTLINTTASAFDIQIKNMVKTAAEKGEYTHF